MMNKLKYRLLRLAFKTLKPFLRIAKKYYDKYKTLMPDYAYNAWAVQNEDNCFVGKQIHHKPLISVVVPIYNPAPAHFWEMLYSVVNQHYENWELIVVNASSNQFMFNKAQEADQVDTRIKIINVEKNEGISGNTNIGINEASGEYIAFFDHDDLLHPCALHSVVECLQTKNKPDLLYTDEDKITHQSDRYFNPLLKDSWSPDLMENANYINHLTVVRADLVKKIGGLRPELDGAQDYDFLLRLIDQFDPNIKHVPRVLYHWRAADSSTAQNIGNKQYIFTAGVRALSEHIKRKNIPAEAKVIKNRPGFYKLSYKPTKYTIVIGRVSSTKYKSCAKWLSLLTKDLDPKQYELIIGEWYREFIGSQQPEKLKGATIITIDDQQEEYWQQAIDLANNPVIIGFKIAAMPLTEDGLQDLVAVAADPRHRVVSPTLLNASRKIVDNGIICLAGFPKQMFEGCSFPQDTYYGTTEWVRNVNDVTTNIVVWRKDEALKYLDLARKTYEEAPSINTLHGNHEKQPDGQGSFVVWAHTPFELIGVLDNFGSDSGPRQLLSFGLESNAYFDSWIDSHGVDN